MAAMPEMDVAKMAGLITLSALAVLILMRKGFHGAKLTVG